MVHTCLSVLKHAKIGWIISPDIPILYIWKSPLGVSGILHKLRMKMTCSVVCKCLYIAFSSSEFACSYVRMRRILSLLPYILIGLSKNKTWDPHRSKNLLGFVSAPTIVCKKKKNNKKKNKKKTSWSFYFVLNFCLLYNFTRFSGYFQVLEAVTAR